jgi:hypothetical protein
MQNCDSWRDVMYDAHQLCVKEDSFNRKQIQKYSSFLVKRSEKLRLLNELTAD